MKKNGSLATGCLILFPLFAAAAAIGQEHQHAPAAAPVPAPPAGAFEGLSAELRGLFREEMVALQGATMELVPAIVSGDSQSVERLAERMRAGYVLAQKLTAAQREEIERLPAGFLERDAEFHELAAGLASGARERRGALVSFHFYKLTESCVGCHARYALHRFPGHARREAPAHQH